MALNNGDQVQLRDYLLGRLSGDEQQKIEERLMVEDELFEEFVASKD
jgi:anti-sigma-K factor RskA